MAKKSQKKIEQASQEDAQKMIDSGVAKIPAEAIIEDSKAEKSSDFEKDYEMHPKFSKFKQKG